MGAWPFHSIQRRESAGPVRMRVAYSPAGSAGHQEHLRRKSRGERRRGHVAAGEDPAPARLGPGPWPCALRTPALGLTRYPEIWIQPRPGSYPSTPKLWRTLRSSASLCSPDLPQPREDSASLNLTPGSSPYCPCPAAHPLWVSTGSCSVPSACF